VRGIKERPISVSMNEPLSHSGMTFYQASYNRVTDPHTGRETGQFMSVFQVRKDPAWPIIYGGCLLVVLGTFVQFYMRAGPLHRPRQAGGSRADRRTGTRSRPQEAAPTPADGRPVSDGPRAAAVDVPADFEEL
jgi:hypothetical protein